MDTHWNFYSQLLTESKRCFLKIISKISMNTKIMSARIPLKFLKNISPFLILIKYLKNLNLSKKFEFNIAHKPMKIV